MHFCLIRLTLPDIRVRILGSNKGAFGGKTALCLNSFGISKFDHDAS